MATEDKESIKNWNPYDTALEVTTGILDEINELVSSNSNSTNFPENSLFDTFKNAAKDLDLPLKLQLHTGNNISNELLEDIFDLTRCNMKSLYDQSRFYGGWDDRKKISELRYHRTHIITLMNDSSLVGFASYRFIVMREGQPPTPVCYIYELQMKGHYRGKGLGRFMMYLVEKVAKTLLCKKLMCTVLSANWRALSFYLSKCKFVGDESDPNSHFRVLKLEI